MVRDLPVRVRFAPSPTGFLHVGGARTALFNWLFARRHRGTFLLRIEDTDVKRSSEDMVAGILEGLEWLGLDWDEGPFFQSQRRHIYTRTIDQLLAERTAYRDFSSPELENREYRCFRDLSESESNLRAASESFAVRFRVPTDHCLVFEDRVFGQITVQSDSVEDFVIQRSDGSPTYHLTVVADDVDMDITHVVRGADHLSNTGKHILLYQALGITPPVHVHLPLILGPDKKRLSKRHGATSVTEFRDRGFLPQAVRNYIALLGWSPGEDIELIPEQDLIRRFDLNRVSKANAVFDYTKLEWMNKRYLSSASAISLEVAVRTELETQGLWNDVWATSDRDWLMSVIDLIKTRVAGVKDFPVYGRAFFTDEFLYEEAAVARYLEVGPALRNNLLQALRALRDAYSEMQDFAVDETESILRSIAEGHALKAGLLIGAVRVATTGQSKAPGIFDVLVTLGKSKTIERLDRVIRFLSDD